MSDLFDDLDPEFRHGPDVDEDLHAAKMAFSRRSTGVKLEANLNFVVLEPREHSKLVPPAELNALP